MVLLFYGSLFYLRITHTLIKRSTSVLLHVNVRSEVIWQAMALIVLSRQAIINRHTFNAVQFCSLGMQLFRMLLCKRVHPPNVASLNRLQFHWLWFNSKVEYLQFVSDSIVFPNQLSRLDTPFIVLYFKVHFIFKRFS